MKTLSNEDIEEIKRLRSEGFSYGEIAKQLGIGKATAWKYARGLAGRFEQTKIAAPENEKVAKAFGLFEDGRSLINAVISLKINPRKAESLYKEYSRLKGLPGVRAEEGRGNPFGL